MIRWNAYLDKLGTPDNDAQQQALDAFKSGEANMVRVAAAVNLTDPFIAALGYMVSIPKKPPTLPILLREASRSIADWHQAQHGEYAKESALRELEAINAQAFGV